QQWHLRIEVRSPTGRTGLLSALPLPAPLHLLPSFVRYPHLTWQEKVRAIPALLRVHRERDPDRPELRRQSFQEWLRRQGQSARAVANFWDLITIPSLNDASDDVAASMGIRLFQEALLWNAHGADVGYARAGLSEIMGAAIERRLRDLGARVLLGRSVQGLEIEEGKAAGVTLAGGETLHADWYVSALPPGALMAALPGHWREQPFFAPAAAHTWSPIVNLHVWYDRPIGSFDFLAFVDSPVQWVFNRTRIAGLQGPGQYITVSLSGAWEFWPLTKEDLRGRFIPELARLFPAARDAAVERFVVVKEQHATFRSLPNGPPNRLPTSTPIERLFLAGDWTDTGWPATMEGAVRSGEAAARAIVETGHSA
ncbi:MAG: hydroxysqualene dehydroxylase HpnE, partial [Dehalococcoidia bacterium]